MIKFEQIGKLTPSKDFKEQAKKRLMQKISQEQSSWLEVLLRDFQNIRPESSFYILSKERLLHKTKQSSNWWFGLNLWQLCFNRKSLSLATAFAVFFLSIATFSVYTPQTVEASNTVYLVITKGNPIIKPLGENWQMASQLQELKIGDTIQTDQDDVAEIHFFDNSITRLAYNTEITITAFFKQNQNEKVELELNKGRAWNKVIQAIAGPSEFTVKTHNSSVSAKNATFDIVAGKDQPTAINVIDRLIDVRILQPEMENVIAKTKVAEGYKVEVQVFDEKTVAQNAQITPFENVEKDVWMTENLAKDKEYLDDLEKKREEKIIAAAGILPNSPLYKVKQGFEGAKNAMQSSDAKTEDFLQLKKKFQEAAALNATGDLEASNMALIEFQSVFAEMKINENLKTDLETVLLEMQSDYTTVLPGDPDYQIKELLKNLELQVAKSPDEILMKRQTEKLFEAQDLVDQGQSELALGLLASINQSEVILTSTGAFLEEEKKTMILQKTEELQILQALKENAKAVAADDLVALVDNLEQNAVQTISQLTPPPPAPIVPVKPIKPVQVAIAKKTDPKLEAQNFIAKIQIYKTKKGQDNQLLTLLNKIPNNPKQLPILVEIRKLLPPEKQYLVTQKMLEVSGK